LRCATAALSTTRNLTGRPFADPRERDRLDATKEDGMSTSPPPIPSRSRTIRFLLGVVTALLAVLVITVIAATAMHRDVAASNAHLGSGVARSESRRLPAFTSLELAGSNVVAVHVGSSQSVVVHADDNLLGRLTTTVHDGRLSIGSRGSFETTAPMHVDLTVPALASVTLSGSGRSPSTASRPRRSPSSCREPERSTCRERPAG
jgi:hypothetical protein